PQRDAALIAHPDDPAASGLPPAHHLDGFGEHHDVFGAVDEPAERVVLALPDGAVDVEAQHRDAALVATRGRQHCCLLSPRREGCPGPAPPSAGRRPAFWPAQAGRAWGSGTGTPNAPPAAGSRCGTPGT